MIYEIHKDPYSLVKYTAWFGKGYPYSDQIGMSLTKRGADRIIRRHRRKILRHPENYEVGVIHTEGFMK